MADDTRTQQVSLGCGTLILIALIVLIFSGGDTDKLEGEVKGLRSDVTEMKRVVENQTLEIEQLQQTVNRKLRPVAEAEEK